jgi:hypothetical protein
MSTESNKAIVRCYFEEALDKRNLGLLAACLLGTLLAGCVAPEGRDKRGATSIKSSSAPSAVAQPRFAQGGPDAEEYGASQG